MSEYIDLRDNLIQTCLNTLLSDKTTKKNILFATDNYTELGEEYRPEKEIRKELLPAMDLKPRILKSREVQAARTRVRAEVMTPSWLCCFMNNHCDDEWFGAKDIFNHMEGENWTVTEGPVVFPEDKTWMEYVDSRRLEITCGEAPFLVSRYDATTGEMIAVKDRIGILDRKLRVVGENTSDLETWFKWTLRAFQSCYGYEWSGDSLLIARINCLLTFMDYYRDKWGYHQEDVKKLYPLVLKISNVIAWNLWQMDGLTGTVPFGETREEDQENRQLNFFDMGWDIEEATLIGNEGKKKKQACRIYDWRAARSVLYNSLRREYIN